MLMSFPRLQRAAPRDDGVGLAAPQVGVNVRLMVFNPAGRDKPGNESILVNPEIVEQLGGKEADTEGCLSFPQIYGDVEVGRDGPGRGGRGRAGPWGPGRRQLNCGTSQGLWACDVPYSLLVLVVLTKNKGTLMCKDGQSGEWRRCGPPGSAPVLRTSRDDRLLDRSCRAVRDPHLPGILNCSGAGRSPSRRRTRRATPSS